MVGYEFPSTLKSIGEMAFKHSPRIRNKSEDGLIHGTLIFNSNETVIIGIDSFWNLYKHSVKYVYAPSLELAREMIGALKVTGDFDDIMEPKVITK
jgi:hypothetical protein